MARDWIRFARPAAMRAVLLVAAAFGPALAAPLPPEVAAALDRAKLPREALVAVVQEVGSATPRLAHQADLAVNPASLMKLATTFAALELLGPTWSWATPVWLQGAVTDGVLQGNLAVKGTGDPKLVVERVWLLLRRVQQLGVREIRGDIVLDRSAFSSSPASASASASASAPAEPGAPEPDAGAFDGEPLRPYNVRADALLLNQKTLVFTFTPDLARGVARVATDMPLAGVRVDASVPLGAGTCDDWRSSLRADFSDPLRVRFAGTYAASCLEKTWPVAYADPKRYNERALAGLWAEMGGRLTGTVRDGAAPTSPAVRPDFEFASPPLAEVVRDINKYSNNVMAQQLFLTLGLTQRGAGTPEAARDVLRTWALARLGPVAGAAFVIDNGSGLSREARVTAQALARLLQVAWSSPVMPELMSSLPVTGLDGTLKRSRAMLGRAHLKTGSLRDVNGVAGYVLGASGRRHVVVAIVNHPNANAARPVLDALVQWAAVDADAPAPSPATETIK